jgi:hypothetical protein
LLWRIWADSAANVKPASHGQTVGCIEEDVDHERVLPVSSHIADQPCEDGSDPWVVDRVSRKAKPLPDDALRIVASGEKEDRAPVLV